MYLLLLIHRNALLVLLMDGKHHSIMVDDKYTNHNGYNLFSIRCDFFNTSIFFGVMAFLAYTAAVGWDIYFNCCGGNRGRLSEGFRGKHWRRR
jgi:hypothetical protein